MGGWGGPSVHVLEHGRGGTCPCHEHPSARRPFEKSPDWPELGRQEDNSEQYEGPEDQAKARIAGRRMYSRLMLDRKGATNKLLYIYIYT